MVFYIDICYIQHEKHSTGNNSKRQLGSTQFWKEIFICSLFSKPKSGLWSFMRSDTNLDMTLSSQVVDLCWLCLADDLHQTHAVCHIAVVQLHVCQSEPKPHTDSLLSRAEHINKQSCFCLMGHFRVFSISFQRPHQAKYADLFGYGWNI